MSDGRKRLYDLKKDEELKVASWHAARGAARGAAGVRLLLDLPPMLVLFSRFLSWQI